jgi:hypothetical protein
MPPPQHCPERDGHGDTRDDDEQLGPTMSPIEQGDSDRDVADHGADVDDILDTDASSSRH